MPDQAIFQIEHQDSFEALALDTFAYQYAHVPVYQKYCDFLQKGPKTVYSLEEIPFLPIQFFKTHQVISSEKKAEVVYTSSGTTGSIPSKHFVAESSLYQKSYLTGFEHFYGPITDWTILALLPSYLERGGSSLVAMVDDLIKRTQNPMSGFYLHNLEELAVRLKHLDSSGKKVLLIGVSYALLDLIEYTPFQLKHTVVMETGGMKGQRKELIKEALHVKLREGFGTSQIHSEYGMTELLSQAYSKESGLFSCPPWMKVFTRDPEDPFTQVTHKTGGINVIDLANKYSCSFIATQDLGRVHSDDRFQILGRFDHSDLRGCNLMVLS